MPEPEELLFGFVKSAIQRAVDNDNIHLKAAQAREEANAQVAQGRDKGPGVAAAGEASSAVKAEEKSTAAAVTSAEDSESNDYLVSYDNGHQDLFSLLHLSLILPFKPM